MTQKWMRAGWICFSIAMVFWILPFGIVWIVQGKYVFGAAGLALCLVATWMILAFVPWKYPDTRMWKLLIPPYSMFLLAVLLLVYVLNGFRNLAEIQYGMWLIPCFVPFMTFGYRTWNSFHSADISE